MHTTEVLPQGARRAALAACAAALLALGACTRPPAPAPAGGGMTLRATGRVEASPDEATFTVQLNCLKRDVKAARTCLVDESNALTERLVALGIAREDLLTTAVTLNKEYDWSRSGQVFKGYRAATSLHVTIRDLARLDGVYTELLENRQLELYGLSYTHSRLDSLRNAAYVAALAQADGLADRLLTQLPDQRREVVAISNVDLRAAAPQPTGYYGDAVLESAAAAPVSAQRNLAMSTGLMRVEVDLYVTYRLRGGGVEG